MVLDLVRAAVVLALPFVTEIWQIYLLIGAPQASSAAFTPTFQAVIPDIVTEESGYTRALSASQVAYTMESLLSPVLAAVALTFMTFNWLFVGTSVGFVISAALVLSTRIPNAALSRKADAWNRVTSGARVFFATPRLRGVMALNMVVAAAGSIVVVNTVNYVRDQLNGSQADVAWALAASGSGTLVVALFLPRVLDRLAERVVMMAGAGVLLAGVLAAVVMTVTQTASWMIMAAIWMFIGGGMALVVTPTGRVIRRSVAKTELTAAFAAQFSVSHLAWLVTYPIAGWIVTASGFTLAWSILAALAIVGTIAAKALWPWKTETEAVDTSLDTESPIDDLARRDETTSSEGLLAACQCASVALCERIRGERGMDRGRDVAEATSGRQRIGGDYSRVVFQSGTSALRGYVSGKRPAVGDTTRAVVGQPTQLWRGQKE